MTLSKKSNLVCRLVLAGLLVSGAIKLENAQSPGSQFVVSDHLTAKDFAGTWNWMFKDRRFATLVLNVKDNQLAGTVTHEWMNMDEQGRITGAEPRPGSSPISKTFIKNGTLSILEKIDGEDMEWAMTLTSPTSAELRIVGQGAPPNADAIRLEKVWSEPPVDK